MDASGITIQAVAMPLMPKTRPEFWAEKLKGNVTRDEAAARALQ
jgi:G:T-mismatch repair DNA endonuclease (very short patch repair protein)